MNWIILIIAGLFEVGFTFCLGKIKGATGTDFYLWGAGFVISVTLSMFLLAKAAQTLPIGTAYPVWTGIGAVGTVLIGILFFHEPATLGRLFFYDDSDYFNRRVETDITRRIGFSFNRYNTEFSISSIDSYPC